MLFAEEFYRHVLSDCILMKSCFIVAKVLYYGVSVIVYLSFRLLVICLPPTGK